MFKLLVDGLYNFYNGISFYNGITVCMFVRFKECGSLPSTAQPKSSGGSQQLDGGTAFSRVGANSPGSSRVRQLPAAAASSQHQPDSEESKVRL